MTATRRGRPRPPGDVVQRHGRQPPAPDPPAGEPLAGPAALRLRRLARAAHPADDDPDGRRPASTTRARTSTPRWRGRPSCCTRARPVRGPADRPARDQPVRRRGGGARRRGRPTCAAPSPGSSSRRRTLAERRGSELVVQAPASPCDGRGRPPPGRAHPAQPPRQRHRARRRAPGRRHVGVERRRGRGGGRATTASACARARRPWSSTASGGPTRRGPAPPAAPAWAWRSRSRTPGCTTAGCRPGASRAQGSCFRLTLPRRAGVPITGRRCRWCPTSSCRPAVSTGRRWPSPPGRRARSREAPAAGARGGGRPGLCRQRLRRSAVGGPVQQGMAVGEPAQQPIHVSPFGPVVGASPEDDDPWLPQRGLRIRRRPRRRPVVPDPGGQ